MTYLFDKFLALVFMVRGIFAPRVVALPVKRDNDGEWWLDVESIEEEPPKYRDIPSWSNTFDGMPDDVRERVAILAHVDKGQKVRGVGKKLNNDAYLVYLPDRHYKPEIDDGIQK